MVINDALRADVANLTSTATIAPTCSATQAPASAPGETQCSKSEGISTGGAIGIGVGVGAPLAMATAALLILLLREKRKATPPNKPELEATHQHHPAQGVSSSSHHAPVNSNSYYGHDDVNRKDAPSSEIMGTPRHEMGT